MWIPLVLFCYVQCASLLPSPPLPRPLYLVPSNHCLLRSEISKHSHSWKHQCDLKKGNDFTQVYISIFVSFKSACFTQKVHSFASIVYPPAQLPQRVTDFTGRPMQESVSDVKFLMTMTRLQLNGEKTEAMLVMSKRSSTSGPV